MTDVRQEFTVLACMASASVLRVLFCGPLGDRRIASNFSLEWPDRGLFVVETYHTFVGMRHWQKKDIPNKARLEHFNMRSGSSMRTISHIAFLPPSHEDRTVDFFPAATLGRISSWPFGAAVTINAESSQ
jgi:hypothetical protein